MKKQCTKVLLLLTVQLFWAGLSLFAQPYFINNQDPLSSSKKWVKVENMSDEFNGNSLNGTKWQSKPVENGWTWIGRAPGLFDPSAISVANGKLRVTVSKLPKAKKVKGKTFKYQGAILRSIDPGQPGWYYECKMKANATEMSSTFWLMSKNSNCMKKLELDIQECVGKTSHLTHTWAKNWDKVFHSNCIHRSTNCHPTPVQKRGSMTPSVKNHEKYFVYGCYWKSPTEIQFFLDGKYVYSITPSTDFDMPSFITMAIETYDWNPVPSDGGKIKTGTWEERTTQYDWVRVWKTEKNNNNNTTPSTPTTPSTGNRTVSLQNMGNKLYVSSENGKAAMTCKQSSVGSNETFTMIPLANGKYAFKSSNGNYVCSENGAKQMSCDRTKIGTWEQFTLIDKGNNNFILKGNNGQHVRANMWCTSTDTDSWRQFKIKDVSTTKSASLKTVPVRPSFNKSKDILLANFDLKPDEDDVHSAAALACLLKHKKMQGVNYYAVAGAYGTQGGQFITAAVPGMYNTLFGAENTKWTNANANWNGSVTRVVNKVKPILKNGGKVFVQEAGSSDFSYDVVQKLLAQGVSAQTIKTRFIVVQHSEKNEEWTTQWQLTWMKNNTDYRKIDDGNGSGNSTPGYLTKNTSFMNQAKASSNPNANARVFWTKADYVCDNFVASWENKHIKEGGLDFSDFVEDWWIFELGSSANNISNFWKNYVTNNPGTTPATNDAISFKNLPTSFTSQKSYTVKVNYTATQSRDIVVEFWNDKWLGSKIQTVQAGTGTANMTVNLASAPAPGNNYEWRTSIRPVGTNWQSTIAGTSKSNITITANNGGGDPTPTPSQMTLNPIHDTYMEGSSNKQNTLLRIEKNRRVIYLQYDLSNISNITSASLKMTCSGDNGSGTIDVYKGSSNNWTESNLSNSNKPAKQTKLGSLNKTYTVGSSYNWTLNASTISGGGKLSLILVQTGGNDAAFGSKENGVGGPKLIVNGTQLKAASASFGSDYLSASEPKIQVYPNPFTDVVNIDIGQEPCYKTLRILALDGHVISTQSLTGKSGVVEINIASLSQTPSGLYLFQVIGTNDVTSLKVIKK